jgi:[histone H3]-lysine4 N-trimethyltransferase ASH1L
MFESLVNSLFLVASSGDLSNSQVAASSSKMGLRRTRSSSLALVPMAADPVGEDHHLHETSEDTMAVRFSPSLPTPENSRSETSSNNEHALVEEKPVPQHTSMRVTRASLQALEKLDQVDKDSELSVNFKGRSASDETLAACHVDENEACPSFIQHGIDATETLWSQPTPMSDRAVNQETVPQCDTPVSKESLESTGSSLRPRPIISTSTTKEPSISQKADAGDRATLRRSSRLSLLGKTSEILESILGKRSRDIVEKGMQLSRRASLRPRNVMPPKEEKPVSTSLLPPAAKKRRFSESDLPAKSAVKESPSKESSPTTAAPVQRHKPKRWLPHGLYIGQDRHMDPRLNEAKNRLKSSRRSLPAEPQRTILPMPMFAGERLLKNGRDFKLPFDIFSPLPPGQPKPDEWRKTNKSKHPKHLLVYAHSHILTRSLDVFVGEAASIWKANKPIELSTCTCSKDTGCDENCQNRYMFYECDDTNCKLGQDCGNRSFDELKQRTKAGGKYNIGVEVIKTADRGYGVRSNRTFEPNQIIVEYTGEIITQSECERRMKTIYKNNEVSALSRIRKE